MPLYCEPDADIGFVYVWFNKLNHRYYIGSRKGHPNDGYVGSGNAFKSAYKKYGPENFVRHIEYYGPDYRQEETDLIKFFDACNCSESYNLLHIDKTGYSVSEETRKKFRQRKHSAETIAKIRIAKTDIKHTDETRARMSAARKGRTFSDEHRANIRASLKGKPLTEKHRAAMKGRIASEEHRRNISNSLTGKKLSEETKAKLSNAVKALPKMTCPHCGNVGVAPSIYRYHFNNCKMGA